MPWFESSRLVGDTLRAAGLNPPLALAASLGQSLSVHVHTLFSKAQMQRVKECV